jgi:mannose-1-phosphate guanylyltransferase
MNAMILAAGLGTRLGHIGRDLPKVLVDIGGRPLLDRHLRYLERQGIRRVVLNTHHQAEQIESFVAGYTGPLEVVCIFEERLLGTAGGVRNALSQLSPGPFIVLYGDVLVDEPLEEIVARHTQTGALATLAVHEADSAEGKGVVKVNGRGRVTGFTEKGAQTPGRVLINSGLYVIEEELVSPLVPGVELDFGRDVFPAALVAGSPLYAVRLPTPIIDIGTPGGLRIARAAVAAP